MRSSVPQLTGRQPSLGLTQPSQLKMINMGIRPSLIPILIEFLTDRKMTVNFNLTESSMLTLIGGWSPGIRKWTSNLFISSDDNAHHVHQEDHFKYCDDLQLLELVTLGDVPTEYNFTQHVASDIG